MKKDAVFKQQRVSKVPINLRDRIQELLDVLKKYDSFTCQQRTIVHRQHIHKPSDHPTKRRITKNRLRRWILEHYGRRTKV